MTNELGRDRFGRPARWIANATGWLVATALVVTLALNGVELAHHGLGPRSSDGSQVSQSGQPR